MRVACVDPQKQDYKFDHKHQSRLKYQNIFLSEKRIASRYITLFFISGRSWTHTMDKGL